MQDSQEPSSPRFQSPEGKTTKQAQNVQNTILDEKWDDSVSVDQAILQSLMVEDMKQETNIDPRNKVSFVLAALKDEIAQIEEREIFGELVQEIENYIGEFGRSQIGNMVDFTDTVSNFMLPLRRSSSRSPAKSDLVRKDIGQQDFETFLDACILTQIQNRSSNHKETNKDQLPTSPPSVVTSPVTFLIFESTLLDKNDSEKEKFFKLTS